MRELTYYVACSVDGFIAHTDGSHDGFSQDSEYFSDLFSSFPETVPYYEPVSLDRSLDKLTP